MKTFVSFVFCLAVTAWVGCGKPVASGYEIAVIPKGTSHEFWKSIHAGALQAEAELTTNGTKVKVIWKGPLREDDRDGQIQVVENFTVRRVAGIVLAPLDAQALVAPIEAAAAAGVPVIVIDSAVNTSQPISYVATDNFKGGQMAGEYLGKLLTGQGKVILLRYQEGSASTEQREAGFLQALTNRFPAIQLLSTDQYSGATRDSALVAAQNLLHRFGHDVSGIFAPCEPVTIGVMLALKDAGRAGGMVKLVGFDATSASVQGLKSGDVQGLVVQNPVRMGYLGVKTMVDHLKGNPIPKVIDTGVELVTVQNMEEPAMKQLLNPPLDRF